MPHLTRRLSAARRPLAIAACTLALLAVMPGTLSAHAVVFPKTSAAGAYERFALRVPNEKNVATTRVELRVPAGLRVTAFADVPGWQLEVLTDSAQRITGAVWTGTLAPHRFVELPFIAVTPKDAPTITWPAIQTYADGERVEWTGAAGSRTPASVTTIGAAGGEHGAARSTWVAWAALALSVVSLGLALRPAQRRELTPP
jgi:uncharacterized protein YcnI